MKKCLAIALLTLGSGSAYAADPDLIDLLATGVSKAIYMTEDCGIAVDKDKFKDLAKLKAFSEGHGTLQGVSWDEVKSAADDKLGALREAYPGGAYCAKLEKEAENILPMLKKH